MAAIQFEGWASTPEAAERLAPSIELVTNHELSGVGGMAGVVSPSQLVYVVENGSHRAYSVNEMDSYFGAFGAAAVEQIRRWNDVVMPVIGRAVEHLGGLELLPIMARALGGGGDDGHCRQDSATATTIEQLAPAIIETSNDAEGAATLTELGAFPHLLFLGIGMAGAKSAMLAAEGIAGSTMVTVMARNGTETGIQVADRPGVWFTAPAPRIDAVLLPGFTPGNVARDMGDSAVMETWFEGANAAASAAWTPLAPEVGLTPDQMVALSRRMARIRLGTHPGLPIFELGGSGPAGGVDVNLVLQKHILPVILTAVAPREPAPEFAFPGLGHSVIPKLCFSKAAAALTR